MKDVKETEFLPLKETQALLEIGFNELGLRRIDLRFYGFNTAAIGCYERAGLVRCIFKQDKVQYKIAQEWLSTWVEKNVP